MWFSLKTIFYYLLKLFCSLIKRLIWIIIKLLYVVLLHVVLPWKVHFYYRREFKVVQQACEEKDNNHLLTSRNDIFSSKGNEHVIEQLVKEYKSDKRIAKDITSIWIKWSPCSACSTKLMNFFKKTELKPTLYIAEIYRQEDYEDRENMKDLLEKGFQLEVWRTLKNKMHGKKDNETEKYLKDIISSQEPSSSSYCIIL